MSNKLTTKDYNYTAKETGFINDVLSGMTFTDAYKNNYDAENMAIETIYVKASQLMDKDKIRVRYNKLLNEANTPVVMTVAERKERLSELARENITNDKGTLIRAYNIQAINTLNDMEQIGKQPINVDQRTWNLLVTDDVKDLVKSLGSRFERQALPESRQVESVREEETGG